MTRDEVEELVSKVVESRLREGVKALFEQILEEGMTAHLGAAPRQRTPLRRGV
jgi:transposase-like protein